MLCTAPTIRTAALSCRMQPTILTSSAYHTSSSPLRPTTHENSPATSQRRAPLPKRNVIFKRYTSNTGTRSVSSASSSSSTFNSTASQASPSSDILDWNTFFQLRKTRRWYQLGSSIGTGLNGFILGAQVLSRSDMDALVGQIPLDPFITMGLITFACGGTGWLLGPILGTGVFNWRNRKFRPQMDAKEKEFYRRIKRFRVDPSASSMANPVPDYYGEKISSVQQYRRWLKDQRAFNKKRQTYV